MTNAPIAVQILFHVILATSFQVAPWQTTSSRLFYVLDLDNYLVYTMFHFILYDMPSS